MFNLCPLQSERRKTMSDLIKRGDAIDAVIEWYGCKPNDIEAFEKIIEAIPSADTDLSEYSDKLWKTAYERGKADRPQEWIDCKEPPSTDRNVFIAYGTGDMKSVCIGHYEHDMKMWYEDRNFFAKPLYYGMYWCEIPQFPTRMKGADDETD